MAQRDDESQGAASGVRRLVGNPTSVERRADAVRAERVRAVGTAFLRWRPIIVVPVAAAQAILMAGAELPTGQRVALALAMASLVVLFIVEAWLVRRRVVTERWLFTSLALTAAGITGGIVLSGGTASPLSSLVLAPLVIAFAAFGRRRAALMVSLGVVIGVAAIAVLGHVQALPWPPLPEPALGWMRLVAFVGAVALTWTGVAGLADAYSAAGATLDALRALAIDEAATRMRNLAQVSARVAHELKNPLAAVKALVQLEAARPNEDERSTRRLGVVLAEVDRMDALVRDYLAFARPAAALERGPVDMVKLLDDVALVLSARAEARGVRIGVTVGDPGAKPGAIVGDRARLREAIFNLVDNAVRASPAGGVVELACGAVDGAHHVTVADAGAGLPAQIAAALAAGDSSYLTTREDGTGLGLAIARAAIAQHGGTLTLEPRPGGGTVARIVLGAA